MTRAGRCASRRWPSCSPALSWRPRPRRPTRGTARSCSRRSGGTWRTRTIPRTGTPTSPSWRPACANGASMACGYRPPQRAASGGFSMGYDPFDHYDLGDKDQRGTLATKFGTKDELLRLIAVAHANGLDVYPDIVLNHMNGGAEGPQGPRQPLQALPVPGVRRAETGRWPKSQRLPPERRARMHGRRYLRRVLRRPGRPLSRPRARRWWRGPVHARAGAGVDGLADQAAGCRRLPVRCGQASSRLCRGGRAAQCPRLAGCSASARRSTSWARARRSRSISGPPPPRTAAAPSTSPYRTALLEMIGGGGFFDMGGPAELPAGQPPKTVPFINSHDTWRGLFHDSNAGSELLPTDRSGRSSRGRRPRRRVRDRWQPGGLLRGPDRQFGEDRRRQDLDDLRLRDYLVNLIWAHQNADFKEGDYRVPFQGLRLISCWSAEKAPIAPNDNVLAAQSATVPTRLRAKRAPAKPQWRKSRR